MAIVKSSKKVIKVKLTGGQVEQVFFDKQPEVFQLRSKGNSLTYISESSSLSDTNFTTSLNGYGVRVLTYPEGLTSLYLLSSTNIEIEITSFQADNLSPQDLEQTQVTVIQNNTMGTTVRVTDPLPVGTNTIGNVNVNELTNSALKVTLVANTDYTVKATGGNVLGLFTSLSDVIVKDGSTEVWKGQANINNISAPFKCSTSIKLNSVTGGVAYIIYR